MAANRYWYECTDQWNSRYEFTSTSTTSHQDQSNQTEDKLASPNKNLHNTNLVPICCVDWVFYLLLCQWNIDEERRQNIDEKITSTIFKNTKLNFNSKQEIHCQVAWTHSGSNIDCWNGLITVNWLILNLFYLLIILQNSQQFWINFQIFQGHLHHS